ncbi:MAG: hypothetical protein AAF497_23400, partial [Planctomycetota bacterium]
MFGRYIDRDAQSDDFEGIFAEVDAAVSTGSAKATSDCVRGAKELIGNDPYLSEDFRPFVVQAVEEAVSRRVHEEEQKQ